MSNDNLNDLFGGSSDFGSLLSQNSKPPQNIIQKPPSPILDSDMESTKSQNSFFRPPSPKEEPEQSYEYEEKHNHQDDHHFMALRNEFSQMAKDLPISKDFSLPRHEDNDHGHDLFGNGTNSFSDLLGNGFTPNQEIKKELITPVQNTTPIVVEKVEPLIKTEAMFISKEEQRLFYNEAQVQTKENLKREQPMLRPVTHSKSHENLFSNDQQPREVHHRAPSQGEMHSVQHDGFHNVQGVGNQNTFNKDLDSLKKFPGPLKKSEEVSKYVRDKIASQNMTITERYLWQLLDILSTPRQEADQIALIRQLISSDFSDTNASGWKSNSKPKDEIQKDVLDVQRLLMEGNIEQGCSLAIENGLWAHALLLSSMMDKKTYQQVVVRFATSAFFDGSPMQTLYLMFAEKGEFIFQSKEELNLGESWKDNVLIVLSNRTTSSGKILEKLGDKLWSEYGDVHAAHFTYLCGEYFDNLQTVSAKIALVGGDHINYPNSFNSIDAIQRTEIFEFYSTQRNPKFCMPKFQEYKLMYARMLNQAGMIQKSYDYVISMKTIVGKNQQLFGPKFLEEISAFEKILVATGKVSTGTTAGTWIFNSFSKLIHGDDSATVVDTPVQKVVTTPLKAPVIQQTMDKTPTKPVVEQKQPESSEKSGSGWFGWLPSISAPKKSNVNFGKPNGFYFDAPSGKWLREGTGAPQNTPNTMPPREYVNSTPPPTISLPPLTTPNGGSDMYQRRSTGGYVDVFNTGPVKSTPKQEYIDDFAPTVQQPPKPKPGSFFRPPSSDNFQVEQEDTFTSKQTEVHTPKQWGEGVSTQRNVEPPQQWGNDWNTPYRQEKVTDQLVNVPPQKTNYEDRYEEPKKTPIVQTRPTPTPYNSGLLPGPQPPGGESWLSKYEEKKTTSTGPPPPMAWNMK